MCVTMNRFSLKKSQKYGNYKGKLKAKPGCNLKIVVNRGNTMR